jgi:PAS domain S-box-containing protein
VSVQKPVSVSNEDVYKAAVGISSEAIWVKTFGENRQTQWLVSEENRKKYELPAGYVPDDHWEQHVHPEDRERATKGFSSAIQTPTVLKFEHSYRFLGEGGRYFLIRDRMKIERAPDGSVVQIVGVWSDITDNQFRESKLEELLNILEEERDRFKKISEISSTAIWEIDFKTKTKLWTASPKTLNEFDFLKVDTLDNWMNKIHPDDRDRVIQNFEWAVSGNENYFDTYRFTKADGAIAYVIDQGTFVRDNTGKRVRAMGSFLDITRERNRELILEQTLEHQRQLNRALQKREEELAQVQRDLTGSNDQLLAHVQQLSEREFILNQSQKLARIGSWEYYLERKEMSWSNEMYNIFGVDHSFNVSDLSSLYKLFDEPSGTLVKDAFQTVMVRQDLPFDITVRLNTPLGYKKWLRMTAYPTLDGEKLIRIAGIVYDITYFKESEERLRTSEEKFSNAFRNNPDLMTILREEDRMVVDVNEKVEPVLGYTRHEIIGTIATDLDFFVRDEDRQRFFELYQRDGRVEMECLWRKRNGENIQVVISSNRLELDKVPYMLSVIRDISDRRHAEERFRKAFDMNPDLMLIFRERDLVLVEVNSQVQNFAGYIREEILGKSSNEFNLWSEPADRKRYFETLAVQDHITMESTFLMKDGTPFVGILSAQRILLNRENHLLVVVRDVTERKKAERAKEQALYLLNERVKELRVLYHCGQLLQQEWPSIEELLQEIVTILPEAYQYPEVAAARILLGLAECKTSNFGFSVHSQKAEFHTPDGLLGIVEVVYLEERPNEDEGPFSSEERNMIDLVAEMIKIHLTRKQGEEALMKSEANLRSTINNTEIMIWSVDRNLKLLTYNQPFALYMKEKYKVELYAGMGVLDMAQQHPELVKRWEQLYFRALSGELVSLEERRFEFDFKYSLSPILEGHQVIGVSVFADNVTERKARDLALAEAHKKMGELRLMALRSVMNPHFVFNALNSIQYFIAKNDRQNAINYLSTFSKLIRGILTHSVNDTITLADELNLLTHYINLEMVRFENKFEFKLMVDQELDLEAVEIPSLLVQPYVENAILHGLYNKTEKGLLTISVRSDKEAVLFEVEDNGVGRKESQRLREQNFPKHKSMGTVLTEERLKLINENENVSLQVEDLYDGETRPTGTRVRIWVKQNDVE